MRPAPAPSFLDVARPLAVAAAERIMTLRLSPLSRTRKADHSLVTNADHEADQILHDGLRKAFPRHAILTEESGLDGSAGAEYLWLVDPLDGTSAFAADRPGYSVMVGLLKDGLPYAGVVVDPVEGHIYEAVRGSGAFHTLQNKRMRVHVSKRGDLSKMRVITSPNFPPAIEMKLKDHLQGPWVPSVNSVGIKVGYVVRQVADIYINYHGVHLWDTCSPQIILEEAGGRMTFWDGSRLVYDLMDKSYQYEKPTLATNDTRHEDVSAILKPLS